MYSLSPKHFASTFKTKIIRVVLVAANFFLEFTIALFLRQQLKSKLFHDSYFLIIPPPFTEFINHNNLITINRLTKNIFPFFIFRTTP